MPTSGDLKSGDFFSDQDPPPMELTNVPPPPENYPFNLDPYSPPFTEQFCGKNVDLSVRDFNWLNTYPIKLSLI